MTLEEIRQKYQTERKKRRMQIVKMTDNARLYGIRAVHIAEKGGFRQHYISNWRTGKIGPTPELFECFKSAYIDLMNEAGQEPNTFEEQS